MTEITTTYAPVLTDGILIALLLCAAAVKARRGLYNSLMPLAVTALSTICALFATLTLAGPVYELAAPVMTQKIVERIDVSHYASDDIDGALAQFQALLPEGLRSSLDGSALSEQARAIAREASRSAVNGANNAVYAAAASLVESLLPRYVRIILFAVACAAFLAVFTVLKNTLGLTVKLPLIRSVDKLGGAALGLVECAVAVFVVLRLARIFGFTAVEELSEGTRLLSLFVR